MATGMGCSTGTAEQPAGPRIHASILPDVSQITSALSTKLASRYASLYGPLYCIAQLVVEYQSLSCEKLRCLALRGILLKAYKAGAEV